MKNHQPIGPKIYDKKYFLNQCTGFEEFKASYGKRLNPRLQKVLELASFKKGMKVLDIGCGRGELVVQALKEGCNVIAIDYSLDAVKLTRKVISKTSKAEKKRVKIYRMNAKEINFLKNSFDVIIMADFVEHLHDWELKVVYEKCFQVLKKGGKIVIHTAPNKLFIKYTYPILRAISAFKGKDLGDVRVHYPDHNEHVNEHSPAQLRKALIEKFKVEVWSENLHHATFINKIPVLNKFAVSILAVATKL